MEKTPLKFNEFAREYWIILFFLAFLPIIGIISYCIVFQKGNPDASAWSSIIAGLFTYLGTITLGIFTFYHTWQQEKIQAILREIKVRIDLYADFEDGFFIPFSENELNSYYDLSYKSERVEHSTEQGKDIDSWGFLGFEVENINSLITFDIKFIGIFFVDKDNKLQEIRNRIKVWESSRSGPIDYKQIYKCFIGCDERLLSKEYKRTKKYSNWFIVISMTDINMNVKYAIFDYVLGETFGVKKYILSEKEYENRIKKYGAPIILTNYNRQFFNSSAKINSGSANQAK